jgi:hypothetical protein
MVLLAAAAQYMKGRFWADVVRCRVVLITISLVTRPVIFQARAGSQIDETCLYGMIPFL